jgi:MHS family proline/betaine transporter-like MFS transporter
MLNNAEVNLGQRRRAIAAGMIGHVLEWYDFAIYGYFAEQIGQAFFPEEDRVARLLSTFGVFAVGFLVRPIGGVLVGHIGDRHGRRAALVFSVTAMAIPTFLIGLLPGYERIGVLAPLALIALRIVQGLSVGGECGSSMVFLVEHAPPGRRGLTGALAAAAATVGILLGSAIGAAFAAGMSKTELAAWGWRLPFLLGLVVAFAGYLLRRHVTDAAPAARSRAPIVETLQEHWRVVLRFAGLITFNAVGFYVSFVYLVSWLQDADGIPPSRALEINSISMVVLIPVIIVAGFLSDRLGRKWLLASACVLGLVCAVPLFLLMNQPPGSLAQAGQLGFVLIIGLYGGVMPVVIVEAAPASVRCTAISLGYNISFGIIGGLTPLVAAWLVYRTGDEIAPAFLIMAAAAVTLATLIGFRETYREPFADLAPGTTAAKV